MPEQRRRFSAQFKAEAVQMVLETGKPIAEVAVTSVSMTAPWATGSTPGVANTPNPELPRWNAPV
jgi:Transposase